MQVVQHSVRALSASFRSLPLHGAAQLLLGLGLAEAGGEGEPGQGDTGGWPAGVGATPAEAMQAVMGSAAARGCRGAATAAEGLAAEGGAAEIVFKR